MSGEPLRGMRILITRPREQSGLLVERIAALGGVPIVFSTIRICPPSDDVRLSKMVTKVNQFDWLVFTSANGVRRFFERMRQLGLRLDSLRPRLSAIGPSTALAIESYGLHVSFIPSEYLTQKLAVELPDVRGRRVMLVRAEGTDNRMEVMLRERGAAVVEAHPYRVEVNEQESSPNDFDAIVFTSPSTVSGFQKAMGTRSSGINYEALVCCIGPVTADAARARGFRVDVVPEEHTLEGVLEALVAKVAQR